MQTNRLCLGLYDELYVIDLELVLYFQADDHYTHVYYASGAHFLLPFGLSKVEAAVGEITEDTKFLVRLGRKYIVNTRRIFHINTIKQTLLLSDDHGNTQSIHLPKPVLRSLMELMRS